MEETWVIWATSMVFYLLAFPNTYKRTTITLKVLTTPYKTNQWQAAEFWTIPRYPNSSLLTSNSCKWCSSNMRGPTAWKRWINITPNNLQCRIRIRAKFKVKLVIRIKSTWCKMEEAIKCDQTIFIHQVFSILNLFFQTAFLLSLILFFH